MFEREKLVKPETSTETLLMDSLFDWETLVKPYQFIQHRNKNLLQGGLTMEISM